MTVALDLSKRCGKLEIGKRHWGLAGLARILRGIRGEAAIKAFLCAGGVERGGKGDHVNIKMPNGNIITIPGKGELKTGLLLAAVKKAGLTPEQFLEFLKGGR